MLIFLPGGKGGPSPLGEKVIKVLGFSFLIGLVNTFIGDLLGLSELVCGCMLGIPIGIGFIVSVVILEKGEKE